MPPVRRILTDAVTEVQVAANYWMERQLIWHFSMILWVMCLVFCIEFNMVGTTDLCISPRFTMITPVL